MNDVSRPWNELHIDLYLELLPTYLLIPLKSTNVTPEKRNGTRWHSTTKFVLMELIPILFSFKLDIMKMD